MRRGFFRAAIPLTLALMAAVAIPSEAAAQPMAVELRGRVTETDQNVVLPGATVEIEETSAVTTTGEDGTYVITGLTPGRYHLRVSLAGYTPRREEVVADGGIVERNIALSPELHYHEVVSVSPEARDAFESYQPVAVLAGQDLAIKLESTLGAVLKNETGVAERSLGPGPARPVIRGLDGDRVLMLQDGQRTGDLSSQSADHGVTINPTAAERIEVVRGPATLLYGANAIGGLVNMITERIPTRPVSGAKGAVQTDFGSAADEAGLAGHVAVGDGRWAFDAGGVTRRSGDFSTPIGQIDNSQTRAGMGHVGAAYTTADGYAGASYQYDDSRYGVPFLEEGATELTPRQHAIVARAERRNLGGFLKTVRGSVGYNNYTHDELDAGEVATTFRNDATDFQFLGGHAPIGRLAGAFGVSGLVRSFETEGVEALSPPVDQWNTGLFLYEEVKWSHFALQFGGRYDHADFSPTGVSDRSFDNFSGSVGALVHATEAATIAVSFARAARNPGLEELYFFGAHPGNFAFEIGNPDLDSEIGYGLDVSFRWRMPRFRGEVTWFRNDIDNFIFRSPLSEEEFDERFGHEEDEAEGGHAGEELPFIEFVGADALLQGAEFHGDIDVTSDLVVEFGLDYVRGELQESGSPLPRIPPFRFRGGARYKWNALTVGGQVVAAAEQDRVFEEETPTDGYTTLDLFGTYSFVTRGLINSITLRVDNVTDELYRNHLSYIKDLVPERGIGVKVVYGLEF
jgi:iron complex outermembrane receptor protein